MNSRVSLLTNTPIFEIDPAEIDCSGRIGFLHSDKAAALGRLMAVDGQRDPIKVVKSKSGLPWKLVTGMHRTQGALLEGIKVWAIEVQGAPEDLADLEASENLHRRPLAPIERAKFVFALATAAQDRIARENGDLKQQQFAVAQRWARVKAGELRVEQAFQEECDDTSGHLVRAYGWQESAADALQLDKRTIRRSLELYRMLVEPFPAEMVEALSAHPVVGENAAQLKALAAIQDEGKRRAAIEALLADPELSADEARVAIGIDAPAGPTPVAHQKFYNQIIGGWSRLGLTQQRQFVPQIASMMRTPELKRALRDRLNEELGDAKPVEQEARVPVDQVRRAMSSTIDVVNRLLAGNPVDDDELEALRTRAQGITFDIPGHGDSEADDAR